MKSIFSITLMCLLVLFNSCKKKDFNDENKFISMDEKSAKLIEADNAFGLEIFRKIADVSSEDNIMISPLSISVALAMAYNGADGETKTQMEETLKLNGLTPEEINASYKMLITALKSLDDDVVLEIANAIFYHQGFTVKDDFINTNKEVYDAEVDDLDFSSTAAIKTINDWVADKTNDKIPTIIEQLSPQAVMVLLNAIYFNGIWKNKFDEDGTHDLAFHLSDGATIQVPMMNKEEKLEYTTNDLFAAVRLPYGIGQYNMIVFLPANDKNSDDVIHELTAANWGEWMDEFEMKDNVVVTMPRFKFEFETNLNQVLTDMGMVKAFLPNEANFSGISDIDLYISEIKHKSYIDVNENGTEAAAVTSITFETTSIGEPVQKIYFNVNKPFVFAITEKDTDAILFIGEVTKPIYPE